MTADATTVSTEFAALQVDAGRLLRHAQALARKSRALAKPDGLASLKAVERDLAALAAVQFEVGDLPARLSGAVAQATQWLDAEWQRRAAEFSLEIEAYLLDRGVAAAIEGGRVVAHPLALAIDARRDAAVVEFAGEAISGHVALDPPRILRAMQEARARLERQQCPPELLCEKLAQAYADVVRVKGLQPGARVRLADVHFQIFVRDQSAQGRQDPRRGRLKDYPRAQFCWDLGLLVANPRWLEAEGRKMTLFVASESAQRSRATSVTVEVGGRFVAYGDLVVVGA